MLQLLCNDDTKPDVLEKVIWTLCNLLIDGLHSLFYPFSSFEPFPSPPLPLPLYLLKTNTQLLYETERSKEIMVNKKGVIQALIRILQLENDKLIAGCLVLLNSFAIDNVFVSTTFGELKGMEILVKLLSTSNHPSTKEALCWSVGYLSLGNRSLFLLPSHYSLPYS